FRSGRILADFGLGQQLEALVKQLGEPRVGADAAVVFALRADRQVRLELLGEDHLLAARALDPQVLGRFALVAERQRVADAGKPAHAACLSAEWTAAASSDVSRRK